LRSIHIWLNWEYSSSNSRRGWKTYIIRRIFH